MRFVDADLEGVGLGFVDDDASDAAAAAADAVEAVPEAPSVCWAVLVEEAVAAVAPCAGLLPFLLASGSSASMVSSRASRPVTADWNIEPHLAAMVAVRACERVSIGGHYLL